MHSRFDVRRSEGFAISMPNGIYLFKRNYQIPKSKVWFRFLPKNGKKWTIHEATFPQPDLNGFFVGGLAISSNEFLLFREAGCSDEDKASVIKYRIDTDQWIEMGCLEDDRVHYSAIVFNGKIIVCCGGRRSTEIIPLTMLETSTQSGNFTNVMFRDPVGL